MVSVSVLPHYSWGGMLALSFIDRIVDNIYKSVKKNGYMSIKKMVNNFYAHIWY